MSGLTTTGRRSVKLLLEGLVVVVSILIAFGLDAWWDRTVERRDFLDDLTNVEQELSTNIERVGAHIDLQIRAVASIDVLLDQAQPVPTGGLIAIPDTIILSAFVNTPSYDPSTGAVDALIASGRLSKLDDRELMGILTDFRTAVLDIREDELNARAVAHEKVLPLFWQSTAIASAFGKVNDFSREDFGRVAMESEPVQLPHVVGLTNRLLLRRAWLISAVRELEIHQDRLDRAAELMEAQLGKR